MVHDHVLNLDQRCFLSSELLTYLKHLIMHYPDVRPSEVI